MWAIVIAAAFSVVTGASAEPKFAIPSGATNFNHVTLQPGVHEQDVYSLTVRYPDAAAVEHYSAIFSNWRDCSAPNRQWESYLDASGPEHRYIHHLTRHWVSPDNEEIVTLVLRYESPGQSNREAPSNDRQIVTLVWLRMSDPEKYLESLGATCAKDT